MEDKKQEINTAESIKKESNPKKDKLSQNGNKMFIEIKARNRYFYIYYRYSLIFLMVNMITFLISLLFFIYFINQTVPPRYIPTDNQMRYFTPTPTNIIDRSDSDIQTFIMTTLTDLFAYDYINYNQQLNKSQDNFTGAGWNNFAVSLRESFILQNAKQNKWISSYQNLVIPTIIKKGVDETTGVAYWLTETKGKISYVSNGGTSHFDDVTIQMRIDRVSTLDKESGIGISRMIIKYN